MFEGRGINFNLLSILTAAWWVVLIVGVMIESPLLMPISGLRDLVVLFALVIGPPLAVFAVWLALVQRGD